MAQSKRIVADRAPTDPLVTPPASYQPGGEVGRMQAELASQLAGARPAVAVVAPGERVVRAISTGGGYLLMLAAYGGVALLFWR